MNIWTARNWELIYAGHAVRSGLRLRCEPAVDPEVRQACKEFCQWLRKQYHFPIRIPIYLKASEKIKAMDGDLVVGTFFEPADPLVEPYIRIAAGDYAQMKQERGRDNALASILNCIAHELTHYFQWVNQIQLTERGYERQAQNYASAIIDEYAQTRDHP